MQIGAALLINLSPLNGALIRVITVIGNFNLKEFITFRVVYYL